VAEEALLMKAAWAISLQEQWTMLKEWFKMTHR